jgi:hypothetical protein
VACVPGGSCGDIQAMPTTLEWDFEGGEDGSQLAARRGTQRVYFGDTVIDDYRRPSSYLRFLPFNIQGQGSRHQLDIHNQYCMVRYT